MLTLVWLCVVLVLSIAELVLVIDTESIRALRFGNPIELDWCSSQHRYDPHQS